MRFIRFPLVERNLLRMKIAYDWLVAKFVLSLLFLAAKLPAEKSTDIAESLGRFLAPILPRYRMAKRNLALAFPEKSPKEITRIARASWGHVARTIAEYVFLDELFDFDYYNPDQGRIKAFGIEKFIELRDAKKPVIIFTAHTGNWEILPIAAATYDFEVTAMFRPPNNRFLAGRVLDARTTKKGHLVPSRAGVAWDLLNVLENNGAVGMLPDQGFTRGPHITFLGREAAANPLLAKLARQFNCDIYPARCIRLPKGEFKLELYDALELPKDKNGHIDIIETTVAINKVIEGWVREYPEQWLWIHDRWKIKGKEKSKWAKLR